MNETLGWLITRMTMLEKGVNSEDSISWNAHREAETLSDPSIVDELAEYIPHEQDKERRRAAYFILGILGKKCRNFECASILISRVPWEENKYVLSGLLNALRGVHKPKNLDMTPVFRLLQDERWLVRHSAIESLCGADSPEAEDQLIEVLRATSNPDDIVYCQATLNEIGTAKSIPYLRKNLDSRKRDVKLSARLAIEAIESREKA